MVGTKRWGILAMAMALGLSAQVPDDPVMKAKAQRGEAPGGAGDLPPVPRTILEPPPLPPPEEHHRDSRKTRAGKAGKKVKSAPATSKAKGKATSKAAPKGRKARKKTKG